MPAGQKQCAKCGSEKIVPRAHVKDRGEGYRDDGLTVVVDENPGALMFKSPCESNLRADVCGACGFVELYADTPGSLWRAHEKAQGNRK